MRQRRLQWVPLVLLADPVAPDELNPLKLDWSRVENSLVEFVVVGTVAETVRVDVAVDGTAAPETAVAEAPVLRIDVGTPAP